jgi:hypothetical protein
MNKCVYLGLVLGFLLLGCGKKKESPPAPASTNASSGMDNPLNAPANYLGGLAQAQKLAVKTVDIASINRAIQAFQAGEDRYPKDLNELVTTRYLPKLPAPPYGMQLEYNPKTGQIRVVPKPTPPPPANP